MVWESAQGMAWGWAQEMAWERAQEQEREFGLLPLDSMEIHRILHTRLT